MLAVGLLEDLKNEPYLQREVLEPFSGVTWRDRTSAWLLRITLRPWCSIHAVKTLPLGGDTHGLALISAHGVGSSGHTTPLYPAKLHNQHHWSLSPFLLLLQLGTQQQQLTAASL